MSKVYLSYSTKDEEFASELYHRLTRDGIQCFFAKELLHWGDNWVQVLKKGIEESDYIVPIMTPDYFHSKWIREELAAIMNEDQTEFKKEIRPLLLKECELPYFLTPILYIDVSSAEKFEMNYPAILLGLSEAPKERVDILKRKSLPISIASFSKLINEGFIYVDKTQYIYNLVVKGGAYFLSRPRRFGKSLLISILKEIGQGNRELFHDYWIYDRIPWEKYPVIHLDFLQVDHKKLGLDKALTNALNRIAGEFGIRIQGDSIAEKFADLIHQLGKEKPVIVLIDEYDKPLTDHVDNLEKAEENRETLKGFYAVLKSQEEYIRLLFMTGVSRFNRLSIFSDLNHLMDLTFHPGYVKLLGYTEEEIKANFDSYIEKYIDTVPGYSREELFKKLKENYNGYSWDGETFVYNPVSVINFFEHQEFRDFWFATGTPTFLAKLVKLKGIDIRAWESLTVNEQFFNKFDITSIDTDLLLFQTGYLTIKKHEGDTYTLSYPNREVENAFLFNLLEEFSGQRQALSSSLILDIVKSLQENDLKDFIAKMQVFLAAIPYPLVVGEVEKYYHLVFYLVLKLCMEKVNPEHFSNRGRADVVLETDKYIYIMEFKMHSAQKALKQINDRAYYEQFLGQPKRLILVGIGFSAEKRNIADYAIIEIKQGKKVKGPQAKSKK
ncbi:MAG: AAA family ATPase [Candidatus Omnitrophota bacterium]